MRVFALLFLFVSGVSAQELDVPNILSNNRVADADEVMENFNAITSGINNNMRVDSALANVVIGNGLYSNFPNTSSSAGADSGKFQVAVGWDALINNVDGGENTAVGAWSLRANTSGFQNVAVGNSALEANSSGFNNTAVGVSGLRNNLGGSYNTARARNFLCRRRQGQAGGARHEHV